MSWKDLFPKENRYFETENGILYCGDCLEILKNFLKESVDLVLTDPPYGVRRKEEWDDRENFLKRVDDWLEICYDITKTVVVWFCAGSMIPVVLKNHSDKFHRLLVWNKPPGAQFAGAVHSNIWYSIEPILVFAKVIPKTDDGKRYGYACFNSRTVSENMYGHPTTKPVGLIEEILYFYSNKNNLVLDPFLGSETTAVACERLNRRWIGIEIKEGYCEVAKKRLKNVQQTLF